MINRKSLVIYGAVILLLFVLCVPVLQQKLREKPEDVVLTQEVANEIEPTTREPEAELVPDLSVMVWPLQGQVFRGVGLSYAQTFSDYRYHDGIDLQAARGEEVVAVLAGKVIGVETTKAEGTKVTLDHGQGWVSIYAHLEESYLQEGDYCKTGDPLGTVNQPGLAEVLEGPHLHYTLRFEGEIMNPLDYLPQRP